MFDNRITNAFRAMEVQIQARIASRLTTARKVKETGKQLDLSLSEFARFQELKSLAVAQGMLTLEEGQAIYAALGNTPSHFNAQPAHVKAVLTSLFKELIQARMAS